MKKIGTVKKAVVAIKRKGSKGMKIAVIGWGSLLKSARGLKLENKFKAGGPELPIEATRIAKSNGKLVLVIDEGHGATNKVFYAQSKHGNLETAAKEFTKSEKIGSSRVGIIDLKNELQSEAVNRFPKSAKSIFNWAKANKFDAVIFSALGRRFNDAIGTNFSVNAAGNYVAQLNKNKQKICLDYLKSIDKSINTPFLTTFRASVKKKN